MEIKKRYFISLLLIPVILMLTGCATPIPKDALKLTPESLEKRSLQTRKYEGISEPNIDESETKLGLIVGSKDRDASDMGQKTAAFFVAVLTGVWMPTDDKQKLRISLVVSPTQEDVPQKHFVRVTFQRIVKFFDLLSKSVFLEGYKI